MLQKQKGLTLIELLAVIAIIAILFVLLIPQINSAIDKARISGVLTDFHSYESSARTYIMETGDVEKTEDKLNTYLDKQLQSNGGLAKEKGPWGVPYKIKIDNTKKQFVFTTSDNKKEPLTHKMVVSWGGNEIISKYTTSKSETFDDWIYEVNEDGTVTILDYTGSDEKVKVPSEIKDKPVSNIEVGALDGKTVVKVDGDWEYFENENGTVTITDYLGDKEYDYKPTNIGGNTVSNIDDSVNEKINFIVMSGDWEYVVITQKMRDLNSSTYFQSDVGKIKIINYIGTTKVFTIPDKIDEKTVAILGIGSFKGKGITQITYFNTIRIEGGNSNRYNVFDNDIILYLNTP